MKLGLGARRLVLALEAFAAAALLAQLPFGAHGRWRSALLVVGLAAIGVVALVGAAAAEVASRRLRELLEVARRMAEGDLAARARASGPDEIAALAEALDSLGGSLSRTVDELRAERDLLGGILAGMREGVLVLDPQGRVVLVNPALRSTLLLPPDTTGRGLLEVIRHAELKDLLERARAAGPEAPLSAEIELPGIKPRRCLVHATVLPEPAGLLAVFVDVTDLRRLESLRRDFVANASHELRTPVATVRSAAETLRGALDEPEAAAQFVDIIDRNAERLQRLVEDLLDLSRIESREFRLQREPVALAGAVEHAIAGVADRAKARRLALRVALPPDLPRARADRRALEQVLGNLLDNAVKYASEGAEVTVRAAAEGPAVRLTVEDTGPGIEPKHLPRLFERFYRVDAGRSREVGGTGLGLAIVKHLVEAMGGAVAVDSTPGKGTAFHVTLPRGD